MRDHHVRLGLPVAAALLLLGTAGTATAAEKVTAVGQAAVYGTDVSNAKDKAIKDGLRKCVEQAIGVEVKSKTETADYQVVMDKITSQAAGYVKKYKVLSSKNEGGVMVAKLECQVEKSKAIKDADEIINTFAEMEMPRVLLMITEQNVGSSKTVAWWTGADSFSIDLGAAENAFIDSWSPKKIRFVDRQALQGKITAGKAMSDQPSDAEVKTFAMDSGAEVVVYGKAIANDVGPIMGTQMHSIRANISIRALSLDTGEILATSTETQAVGHIDPATGGTKALDKVARKSGDALLQKIVAKWREQLGGARTVSLTISNVKKSKYLRKLSDTLKNQVRGVEDVRQRQFKKKIAVFEVDIKGSAQDLAEELEDKTFPGFEIEIEEITSNTVKALVNIK